MASQCGLRSARSEGFIRINPEVLLGGSESWVQVRDKLQPKGKPVWIVSNAGESAWQSLVETNRPDQVARAIRKTDLVATVSHELRTPLTSVRMVLHLLLEGTLGAINPPRQELVQTARNDLELVLRILKDLLDLARLDEGPQELHRSA